MPSWMKWFISLLVGGGILTLGWFRLPLLLNVFFVMICFVLILVVLLQSGSAADLAGAFGGAGSQTAFNPRGAATVLSKATTWCAIMFMLTAMVLVLRQDRAEPQGNSILQRFSKPAKTQAPVTPTAPTGTQAPAQQPPPSSAPAIQQPPQSQPSSSAPAAHQPAPSAPASQPAQTPPPKKP